jgi:hypothetical protein
MNFYKNFDNLCFSDFDVLKIEIDAKKKKIKIHLEGVWLVKNRNNIEELSQGYVQINNYHNFTSTFSNSISGIEGKATIAQIKELKEIAYHENGNDFLEFGGFINDGSWLECTVQGGEVEAHFTEK